MKIYIDGKYYERDEAKISVFDHGLLYGDGVFEGIRVYSGKIFKLKEHVERLFESAKALMLDIAMTRAEMSSAVDEAVRMNALNDGYVRLVITRGKGDLGLNPFLCPKSTVIIIADTIQLYPKEYYSAGISIITSSLRRTPADTLDPRIKSLNYLNSIQAKIEAVNAGCLEAVMLNREGLVTECTGDNIFIFRRGTLTSPSSTYGSLDGITRQTVLELAKKAGIPCGESAITLFDLYNSEECFLTGSGAELIPVTKVDGRTIGDGKPGPVFRRLSELFSEAVRA